MINRIIHPRVGSNYSTAGLRNQRIMIVGESSYHKDAKREGYDIANQTINVGADAIGYDEGRGYWNDSRFYIRIARMFEFNPRSFAHRKEFWDSVVYYNFLQIVLTKPRENPPGASWGEAKNAFLQTLEENRPEIVITFSKRMWPYIPKDSEESVTNELGLDCRQGDITLSDGGHVRLLNFSHPSSFGFRWEPVGKLLRRQIMKKATSRVVTTPTSRLVSMIFAVATHVAVEPLAERLGVDPELDRFVGFGIGDSW